MKTLKKLCIASLIAGIPYAHAALTPVLGGQAINDTTLNITWLADANYARTSGFSATGLMTWHAAQSWIDSLNAENGGIGHLGYNDWRLPHQIVVPAAQGFSYNGSTITGYNYSAPGTLFAGTSSSEMAHLFYNTLGNKGYCDPATSTATTCNPQAGWGFNNGGPFINMQYTMDDPGWQGPGGYWTDDMQQITNPDPWGQPQGYAAGYFDFKTGFSYESQTLFGRYSLAVRDGMVDTVPLPASAWLFGSALVGLGATRRRRKISADRSM